METVGFYLACRKGSHKYPDGTLIKLHNEEKYYIMESGMKRLLSVEFLQAYDLFRSYVTILYDVVESNAIPIYDNLMLP